MITRFISIHYLLYKLFITTSLFIQSSIQQQCLHPSNYSDFSLLLINNKLVATGANLNQLEVWIQDISIGFDTTKNCWKHDIITTNQEFFSPYKNGIGFQYTNDSIAVQAGDHGSSVMSSMAIYDLNTTSWSDPDILIQGQRPEIRARMSVSVNASTNVAWFYGGRTQEITHNANYFNSFYSFDINSNTWHWPNISYSGGFRPARYGHSSTLISERLFILGGKTMAHSDDANWVISSAGDFQSVLVFDTVTHQATTMATIGDVPPARYSFSLMDAPDGKSIVLFGGQNVTEDKFDASNDIYVLDTCTLNWTRPIVTGIPPIARAGHEAIRFMDRYMIIAMGIQNFLPEIGPIYIDNTAILDMERWRWIERIPERNDSDGGGGRHGHHRRDDCRFSFPFVSPDEGDDNKQDPLNTSVVSNHNKSMTTKIALGITFGILGFLILATAGVVFILRIRKDVDPKLNPRWLPNVLLSRKKKLSSPPDNIQVE